MIESSSFCNLRPEVAVWASIRSPQTPAHGNLEVDSLCRHRGLAVAARARRNDPAGAQGAQQHSSGIWPSPDRPPARRPRPRLQQDLGP